MPTHILLYDETCGFCTSIVQWITRQKRGNQITALSCQFAHMTKKYPLVEKDCLTSIRLYDETGQVLVKGQAVAGVLGILWDSKWPERILGLPVIRQILDLGYTFIAVNRHRLPGIKQWCAAGSKGGCALP